VSLYLTPIDVGDVTILEAAGRITLGENVRQLRTQILDLTTSGRKNLILNLGDINYIDSTGIGELVWAYTTVSRHGGTLKLLKLTKRVQDLLQITKLLTVFEVFEDRDQALKSFAKG